MIRAILFDADGVVQTSASTFISELKALLPKNERTDDFVGEIFAAEKPCMIGQKDFAAELEEVLKKWKVEVSTQQALAIWQTIEPVPAVLNIIARIRSQGIRCYLASNQQSYRAEYMRTTLDYENVFDGAFYSYEAGAAKPDRRYFENILSQLELVPEEILFIDDKADNTDRAQSCGMRSLPFDVKSTDEPGAALAAALGAYSIYIE